MVFSSLMDGSEFGIAVPGVPEVGKASGANRGVFLLAAAHAPAEAQTTMYRGLRTRKQPACQPS
jgi:hypothetical protein